MENKRTEVALFSDPWERNDNAIWLASTISLHRNLDKFLFPEKLEIEKRSLVSKILSQALQKANPQLTLFAAENISPVDRDFLAEHFLSFERAHDVHQGHAYMVNTNGRLLIRINSQDHLHIQMVDLDGRLEEALEHLITVEKHVEEKLPFAFSNQFGYLTSDPCLSGTGLSVSAYIHIPALFFEQEESVEKLFSDPDVIYTDLQGAGRFVGDILVIRNRWSLGVSEESILSCVRKAALRIVAEEKVCRERMREEKKDELIDTMRRCIGTLQNAFTFDTEEALDMISCTKLGVELNWVEGVCREDVNEIFFDCRRAHIIKRLGSTSIDASEVYKSRANILRKCFGSARFVCE